MVKTFFNYLISLVILWLRSDLNPFTKNIINPAQSPKNKILCRTDSFSAVRSPFSLTYIFFCQVASVKFNFISFVKIAQLFCWVREFFF